MSEEVKGLFNKFYGASKEKVQELKKPVIMSSIKSKLNSCHRDATMKIIELEAAVEKICSENYENFDVNSLTKKLHEIENLKVNQTYVKKAWELLFGEEMKCE